MRFVAFFLCLEEEDWMVMWVQLQIEIVSRLAQDQEVGPGGYPLRPTWTTLHPEGTSSSKTVFFPHLSTQYIFFKGKGVHGPRVSLDSKYWIFPLISPQWVSWDGMEGGEMENGASRDLPNQVTRHRLFSPSLRRLRGVSMTTTPSSSSFTFPTALNVAHPQITPIYRWTKRMWNDLSKITWVKRGTELRGSRWAEGRSLKYYKIHVFCLNFLNEVGTQEEIGVVIRFGLMREPACVKYQTSGNVLVSILHRSGVCAGEAECRYRSRRFRPIDLLSPFRKRQVEGNHLNQLCDKATSWSIFFTFPVILLAPV